tara:strand:+ start:96 stop:326 length:231 start_codon:yes stop_codon:yes gene_type:complete
MKPTNQEWIAITAMVFGSVGLVLGILSSSTKIKELEQERDDLLIYSEQLLEINTELMNTHSIVNRVDRVTQPKNED